MYSSNRRGGRYFDDRQRRSESRSPPRRESNIEEHYSSARIAASAKEKARQKKKAEDRARIEAKKDKAAAMRMNIGDTDSEDELVFNVVASDSEAEDEIKKIHLAQAKKQKDGDELDYRKKKNKEQGKSLPSSSNGQMWSGWEPRRGWPYPNTNHGRERRNSRDRRSSSQDSDRGKRSRDRLSPTESDRDRVRGRKDDRPNVAEVLALSDESDRERGKKKRRDDRGGYSSSDSDRERSVKRWKKDDGREKKSKRDNNESGLKSRYYEPVDRERRRVFKKKEWRLHPDILAARFNDPDSYMMNERVLEVWREDVEFFPAMEQSAYIQHFTCALGANQATNDLFGFTTQVPSQRMFDRPLQLSDNPERQFEQRELKRYDDQILLSWRRMYVREEEKIDISSQRIEKIDSENDREGRKMEVENELKRNKHSDMRVRLNWDKMNENLWTEFIRSKGELDEMSGVDKSKSNKEKLEILTEALTSLPRSAGLLLEKMKMKKGTIDAEEWRKEWKEIMNEVPNSIILWNYQLGTLMRDEKAFTRRDWMELADWARNEPLGLDGSTKERVAEADQEKFFIGLMVLRVRMELEMGYTERAIGTIQMLLEQNVFSPHPQHQLEHPNLNHLWCHNLPLVGEPDGKGWLFYKRDVDYSPSVEWAVEMREAEQKYQQKELGDLLHCASNDHRLSLFARHERLHEKYNWRPVRTDVGAYNGSDMDPNHLVEFDELPDAFFSREYHYELTMELIRELGAITYNTNNPDPIGPLLSSFGLLSPSLHSVPDGLHLFVDRILQQLAFDDVDWWEQSIAMSCARIRTRSWFISIRQEPFDMAAVMSELSELAEETAVSHAKSCKGTALEMQEFDALFFAYAAYEAIKLFLGKYEKMERTFVWKSANVLSTALAVKAAVLSGNAPVHQIRNYVNKSVVLVLAALLVKLPGSWDDRVLRVGQIILGKDGTCEYLRYKEKREALRIVEELRKSNCEKPEGVSQHTLFDFFGPDQMQAGILETMLLFADASRSLVPAPQSTTRVMNEIMKRFPDYAEKFYESYVYIMKHSDFELREHYRNAVMNHDFLWNIFLTREYVNMTQDFEREGKMLAELKERAENYPSLPNSIAYLYAQRKHFDRVVVGMDLYSDSRIANGIVQAYVKEAQRHHHPSLWRYALAMVAELKNEKMGGKVFSQAVASCPFSRELHLDYIKAFPDDAERAVDSMKKKQIRIRVDPANFDKMIDEAKRRSEYRDEAMDAS